MEKLLGPVAVDRGELLGGNVIEGRAHLLITRSRALTRVLTSAMISPCGSSGGYIRRHHVGLLALMIALGGTSYAAVDLPRGSVGGSQLRNGAVSTEKLRNGAVTAAKVKAHTLLAKDFKSGQLPAGTRGPTGATGPQGAQGGQGEPGPTAAAFISTSNAVSLSASYVPVVSLSTPGGSGRPPPGS